MYAHIIDYDKDYQDVAAWWKAWGWPEIPREALPEMGLIVSEGEVKICAGFLYRTDSCMCCIDFFVSNPEAEKKQRDAAMQMLINSLVGKAKESGFKAVFSFVRRKDGGLIRRMIRAGYTVTDREMCHLVRGL